jgi:hypothetical protein
MFRWYANAEECLAYLSDVYGDRWEGSKWFGRGWTLQELLAPNLVVSLGRRWKVEGHKSTHHVSKIAQAKRSADKESQYKGAVVNKKIVEITGISHLVLDDFKKIKSCIVFTILSWLDGRTTAKPEDIYYSPMEMFGVSMPTIYGEGMESAGDRLAEEIGKKYHGETKASFRYQTATMDSTSDARLAKWRISDANTGEKVLAALKSIRRDCKKVGLPGPPEITQETANSLAMRRDLRELALEEYQKTWRDIMRKDSVGWHHDRDAERNTDVLDE